MKPGDLVRLKIQYRLVGPMNLWDEWEMASDEEYAPETFKYFCGGDVGIILQTKISEGDVIKGIKLLSSSSEIGWISENLIEVLKPRR